MTHEIRFRIDMLYEESDVYEERMKEILKALEDVKKKWNIPYSMVLASFLPSKKIEEIKSSIREVPPQIRGRIVSSSKRILSLSRTKQLNVKNTPVALLYDLDRLIDIYPHALGTSYSSIEDFLKQMYALGPSVYKSARGLLEDPLIQLLRDDPSILEDGADYLRSKFTVSTGEIDLLLVDGSGRHIVIEVETKASDAAVGQVCRLAHGYAKETSLDAGDVRKVVVYRDRDSGFVEAALGAGVEAYRVELKREA
jgi:hypothetical protein